MARPKKEINMQIAKEKIVAMAVAAVAEELREDVSRLRVVSFREVRRSSLERYLSENKIQYRKYKLGDTI